MTRTSSCGVTTSFKSELNSAKVHCLEMHRKLLGGRQQATRSNCSSGAQGPIIFSPANKASTAKQEESPSHRPLPLDARECQNDSTFQGAPTSRAHEKPAYSASQGTTHSRGHDYQLARPLSQRKWILAECSVRSGCQIQNGQATFLTHISRRVTSSIPHTH